MYVCGMYVCNGFMVEVYWFYIGLHTLPSRVHSAAKTMAN